MLLHFDVLVWLWLVPAASRLLLPLGARAWKQPADGVQEFPAPPVELGELGIGVQQLRLFMVPGKRLFHAFAAILTHARAPPRIVDELQDPLGEIDGIVGLGVERCVLCGKAPFLHIELHDRFAERHVLHDLVHGGDVVHGRDTVGIDANIRCGQHGEELGVIDPAGEGDVIRDLHVLGHLLDRFELRAAAGHGKVNVFATPRVDRVPNTREQQVETLCSADHADIADKEPAALAPGGIGGKVLDAIEIWPGADHENALRSHPTALDGDAAIGFVRGDGDIRCPEGELFREPQQVPEKPRLPNFAS